MESLSNVKERMVVLQSLEDVLIALQGGKITNEKDLDLTIKQAVQKNIAKTNKNGLVFGKIVTMVENQLRTRLSEKMEETVELEPEENISEETRSRVIHEVVGKLNRDYRMKKYGNTDSARMIQDVKDHLDYTLEREGINLENNEKGKILLEIMVKWAKDNQNNYINDGWSLPKPAHSRELILPQNGQLTTDQLNAGLNVFREYIGEIKKYRLAVEDLTDSMNRNAEETRKLREEKEKERDPIEILKKKLYETLGGEASKLFLEYVKGWLKYIFTN